ncbi:hypothetical protein UFOVP513_58 [uncultured Caudovirales phage]|uniref:Uncharacterized protein n=1 Tax=uncultured Caudovirales phage TaxID=2100421 RepID=A0A6J5MS73_9CAUD|nr:hypothetical protein UFOVP513_58 [uncultured Caudovirales phage]
MNKVNQRESNNAKMYVELAGMDQVQWRKDNYLSCAARTLSACIRCSLRQSDIDELRAVAADIGVSKHRDFIC